MGWYFVGWVVVVIGMYIYVLIVDICILKGGIVYQIDVGFIGLYDFIIGLVIEGLL